MLILQFGILVIGFVLLIKGADYFVDGASRIAERFGIPQLVIGLTIVAFGTSAPEAAVSITAALRGNAGITIGNILGSNILNILIILGVTSLIVPLHIKKSTMRFEIPFVIFISLLLAGLGIFDHTVGFMDGAILWGFMIIFMIYLLKMAKSGKEGNEEDLEDELEEELETAAQMKIWKMCLLVAGGLIMIIAGSDLTVRAATEIARAFGMSERIIGLTIVALGTSLPELMTSVMAGIRGNADIAVGNIVGSNIFNILFVVGTAALITPVAYEQLFGLDSIVCILSAVILWLCAVRKSVLTRLGGIFMLAVYGAYLAHIL